MNVGLTESPPVPGVATIVVDLPAAGKFRAIPALILLRERGSLPQDQHGRFLCSANAPNGLRRFVTDVRSSWSDFFRV